MATARNGPAAIALDNGNVLVFGGRTTSQVGADAEVYRPASGTWEPTTPPIHPFDSGNSLQWRAAPIGGGKVLVVNTSTKKAQLFTPAALGAEGGGMWENAPEPQNTHGAATLTGIGGGRALLVGGQSAPEVYDSAAASRWTSTGHMAAARRQSHTATVLSGPSCQQPAPPAWCGKVLVVGGTTVANQSVKDAVAAELFDPDAITLEGKRGVWSLANPDPLKATPAGRERYGATASALARDGSVLVAGGEMQDDADGSVKAEAALIFDPSKGQWTTAGELAGGRTLHVAASLLAGEVLLAGGRATGSPNPLASTAVYRPGAGLPMGPAPRVDAVTPDRASADGATQPQVTISGARLSGVVRVLFCRPESSDPCGSSATDDAFSFEADPAAPDNRVFARARPSTRAGSVHVSIVTGTGGLSVDGDPTQRPVLTYLAPTGGAWEQTPVLAQDRVMPTATVVSGARILVAGGLTNTAGGAAVEHSLADAELYEPVVLSPDGSSPRGRWRPAGTMLTSRVVHTATLLRDGSVMVAGGIDDPPTKLGVDTASPVLSSAERWVATAGSEGPAGAWASLAPMAVPRVGHSSTRLEGPACTAAAAPVSCGDVLVVGGDRVGTAELFDHETGIWHRVEESGVPRARHTATLLPDGRVLVVGGQSDAVSEQGARSSAQLFDPRTSRWVAAGEMKVPRTRHTATLLPDGRVLVAGGDGSAGPSANFAINFHAEDPAHDSAELYDPATGLSGAWDTSVIRTLAARAAHTASLLPNGRVLLAGGVSKAAISFSAELFVPGRGGGDAFVPAPVMSSGTRMDQAAAVLPARPAEACGAACGALLLAGGRSGTDSIRSTANTELFFPTPEIAALTPDRGLTTGGAAVTITGTGLAGATEPSQVLFGDTFARSVTVESDRSIVAVSPRAARPGPVDVRVTGPGGTSSLGPTATFTYVVLDRVLDLAARADTETSVTLTFTAPGDPPANRYVIKQSALPIVDDASFAAAEPLCGGVCEVPAGESVSFRVAGLSPGRTYHFALRALDTAGQPGPLSNPASVTTLVCPAPPAAGPGQVAYPSGYSLVGAPESTVVPAVARLYGWFDRAAGAYSVQDVAEPVVAGRGYWAYFLCPRLVDLAGPGTSSAALPLGAYHASMVGNPSATGAVRVAGADYAARWVPSLNGGAGGYELSGFREAKTLAVGEGMWVFTFSETTLRMSPP